MGEVTAQSQVCVVGLGYVGLPVALACSRSFDSVSGVDVSEEVVSQLNMGYSTIEDISDAELGAYVSAGNSFSSDFSNSEQADYFVICVPTPLQDDGLPDLSAIENSVASVGRVMKHGATVILESSTYPGTTRDVVVASLELETGWTAGADFHVAYSPERIDPSNREFGLTNTPKVVGGLTEHCLDSASCFYEFLGIPVVKAKGLEEAELAKLLENTYRHVNIALVNELVKFCRPMNIDLWDAIRCAESKPFGFEAFYPGPGVGGHCIPIDPHYLSYQVRQRLGLSFRFIELAQEINGGMPHFVAERLQAEMNDRGMAIKGSAILLVGVTYKADVADLRETPAEPLAEILRHWGAEIFYLDPLIAQWSVAGLPVASHEEGRGRDYDAVVLLQAHSQLDLERLTSCGRLVMDTRHIMSGPNVTYL